jgi:hypothetical protein
MRTTQLVKLIQKKVMIEAFSAILQRQIRFLLSTGKRILYFIDNRCSLDRCCDERCRIPLQSKLGYRMQMNHPDKICLQCVTIGPSTSLSILTGSDRIHR